MVGRARRFLAGEDGPGARALPAGELLHPVPLGALLVLLLNDHVLKARAGGAGIDAVITGKLSDLAGLLFFPLLLTAALDLLLMLLARMGAPVDFSLRRWKLALACGGTAGLFVAIKLSAPAAETVVEALRHLGVAARIVVDPTDLLALPMIALAYWLGRAEIARVPLGRLEVIERAWQRGRRDIEAQLADVGPGAGPLAAAVAHYLETGDAEPARNALRSFRAPTAARACHPSEPPTGRTRTARPTDD
ncbi:MAG TPA: hypothetical protein VML75_05030 [Kofleriaceae bacterium]|nr:hypothetical protein [Kofleriaceae bacterium]